MAGDLISALSRLFTAYLHFGGFTCGLDDLLLIQAAERERFELCETAELRALRASAAFADVQMPREDAEVNLCSAASRLTISSFCFCHCCLAGEKARRGGGGWKGMGGGGRGERGEGRGSH